MTDSLDLPRGFYHLHLPETDSTMLCLLRPDLSAHIYNTRAGVGLNVNQRRFEGDAPNPVSMWQLLGRDTERGPLLSAILHRFCAYYSLLRDGGAATVDERYAARLYRREGLHPFSDANGRFSACIHAVCPDGRLVLRDETGRLRTYAFKEVRFETEEEGHE